MLQIIVINLQKKFRQLDLPHLHPQQTLCLSADKEAKQVFINSLSN
jgi:hypothetical protein